MASSPPSGSKLSAWQKAVLEAFFARERGFFLTGGGALSGYHLGHRETSDLDLFTLDDGAFERARHVMGDLAAALGARLEIVQDAPGFRRVVVARGGDVLVVDLVRERVFQVFPEKLEIGGVRVDPPGEILANKLTTLVGRAEERDLIDVFLLERLGLKVEEALDAAARKDGGCTPATLAWLLSEASVGDDAQMPAGVTPRELRTWLSELVKRLRKAALPLEAPGRRRDESDAEGEPA
jgi:hypothetical protein